MNYSISVSLNGVNYFSTILTGFTIRQIDDCYKDFVNRFPINEGFEVTLLQSTTLITVIPYNKVV